MGWLVTGASGMLGTDLCRVLDRRGISVTAVDRGDLDLLDPVAVGEAVAAHDVVVNCAAWTAVDDAETHEEEAVEINAVAPGVLARAAAEHGPPDRPGEHRLRLRRHRADAVRRGRAAGSPVGVRTHQGSG